LCDNRNLKSHSLARLNPSVVALVLIGCWIVLLVAHLSGLYLKFGLGFEFALGVVPFFDFDAEKNAPSLFSSGLFFIAGVFCSVLWRTSDSQAVGNPWLVLSCVCCFLAFDEYAEVHEKLIDPMRSAFGTTGFFYFPWIIPYAAGVGVLALLLIPFWRRIGRKPVGWFAFSAAVYLSGAIGFEMIGGKYLESLGDVKTLTYALIVTVEETLEMLGLIMLVYALLNHLRERTGEITVGISRVDG